MLHILVLAGGTSDEREVSLRSGAAVAEALRIAGHTVTVADPADFGSQLVTLIGGIDVVFPVLHGKGGEDGSLQQKLEAMQTHFVGADQTASRLCFDKWRYKQLLRKHGIDTPDGAIVDADSWSTSDVRLGAKPFVLKPFDGGSSVDTFVVRDPASFDASQIANAFGRHPKMLVEELIEGSEITVGVLIDQALPVIEIIPPIDEEFDYKNKYNGKSQELCPPKHVDEATQLRAKNLALSIHKLCGVRDLSRTDIMISREGTLYVLETNTMPGMTTQSLLPKSAAAAGLTMADLTSRLVEQALRR